VIFLPFGTPGTNFAIGSFSFSFPASTSCRITVEVIVLVLLPMRKRSLRDIGTCLPITAVPKVADQLPWSGDLISTTVPGTALYFIAVGIDVRSFAA
jgi:hypothetical protein